ncbi:xylosyltransferase oxt-like [Pollicipes pollicipes]|uniref:xylosyltransferase oxt-like n=1 Tax=Pollicipes pollicipes TaxID=41117 RepID=UPI001885636B|nr:xylosyltransferase oxt-like [Pollicipes pollicipes]
MTDRTGPDEEVLETRPAGGRSDEAARVARRSLASSPEPESGAGAALLAQLEKAQHNQLTPLKQRERFANVSRLDAALLGFEPRCALETREVVSAVLRAESEPCRRELVEFACRLREGTAYPVRLPNYCPHHGHEYGRQLGCFRDSRTLRLLPSLAGVVNNTEACLEHCVRESFVYGGLQYGRECWCGNMQPPSRALEPLQTCNMTCRHGNESCGGYLAMNVYETGRAVFKHAFSSVADTDSEPVRIVYLMTLNGRDTRQALRLLKMIYHTSHFYFIHVDSRQDYMYRTLLALESQFPNVRLSRWRRATIWGGASLLDMLLHCMTELMQTDWQWDYVLNLSESDMPVKRMERLTEFLTRNKGKNFLKSHGQSIPSFIMKQEAARVARRSLASSPEPESGAGAALLAQLEKAQHNQLTPLKQRERFANVSRLDAALLGFEPRCALETREVVSAVLRAESEPCRRELVEFACRLREGTAYPVRLPNYCPHHGHEYGRQLGCFRDSRTLRLLPSLAGVVNNTEACLEHCVRESFVYGGLQYGRECWCGNMQPPSRALEPLQTCNMTCRHGNESCGGYLAMNVYETGRAVFKHAFSSVADTDSEPVRIVYLMTLNGRDTRQALRLLKMIYHTSHFYFIHVDSRQDYMYRTLLALESQFPNVRLSRWRRATIWGGASLLDMLLHCMTELMQTDWQWDYVLNLSESDMPVKRMERLTEFLTRNKGKNFLKSHGQSIPSFIMKQGLNHSFYECDHHLWRLGGRKLPRGIAIDGGSDWVCLYRDFVQYVTSMEDDLLVGLRTFFNHSLLPAESFFHIALRNSEFCHTLVDNNLHLTNWRRKQGCHCQHKYAVDWCGCSPNDFRPTDMEKIQRTETRDLFFARKFESAISHEAVTMVDKWVHGPLPPDLPALHRHWLSLYHRDDLTTGDDAALTFYRSVARLSVQRLRVGGSRCDLALGSVVTAHVLKVDDVYKGTAVQFELVTPDGTPLLLETLASPLPTPIRRLKKGSAEDRLTSMGISTEFDQKEATFRNFGRVMGVFATPVIMHSWSGGEAQNVTVVVQDPAGRLARAETFALNTTEESRSGVTRLSVRQPLRPGTWRVHVLADRVPVARAEFPVLPLEVYRGRPVNREQAKLLHVGPPLPYSDQRLPATLYRLLGADDNFTGAATAAAERNAQRQGDALHDWTDDIVRRHFSLESMCLASAVPAAGCLAPLPEPCAASTWSSLSPDPKAELHGVATGGRLRRVPAALDTHYPHRDGL